MSEFITAIIAAFSWLAGSAELPEPIPSEPAPTYGDGWVTHDGQRLCVNGAPCADEAGDDSSRYTFDWKVEPHLGIDGQESEPMTNDEIHAVLDQIGYTPETGLAEG